MYLLPSRFCWPDVLYGPAWELFGNVEPGWPRVQAVSDWVHDNISYQVGASSAVTSALDIWQSRTGVCRDFTQLGMTLCRALNVPARYVAGYLPDIAVAPPELPMDFCSWFDVWLEGRWWTFDPRNNEPRIGRVVIARGRDAARHGDGHHLGPGGAPVHDGVGRRSHVLVTGPCLTILLSSALRGGQQRHHRAPILRTACTLPPPG